MFFSVYGFFSQREEKNMGVSPLFLAVSEAEASGPLRLMPADNGSTLLAGL